MRVTDLFCYNANGFVSIENWRKSELMTELNPYPVTRLYLFQDKAELGCLRAIVLFNPDAKGLEAAASAQVESFREKVYATLEEYTRLNNENEPSRWVGFIRFYPDL